MVFGKNQCASSNLPIQLPIGIHERRHAFRASILQYWSFICSELHHHYVNNRWNHHFNNQYSCKTSSISEYHSSTLCRYSNSSVLQYLNTMFCHQIHDSYQWENFAFYFQPMWSSNWPIYIGIQMAILKFRSNRAKHYCDPISIHLALNWHLIVICWRGQFVPEWCSVIVWSQQKRLILAQIIDHGKNGQYSGKLFATTYHKHKNNYSSAYHSKIR